MTIMMVVNVAVISVGTTKLLLVKNELDNSPFLTDSGGGISV